MLSLGTDQRTWPCMQHAKFGSEICKRSRYTYIMELGFYLHNCLCLIRAGSHPLLQMLPRTWLETEIVANKVVACARSWADRLVRFCHGADGLASSKTIRGRYVCSKGPSSGLYVVYTRHHRENSRVSMYCTKDISKNKGVDKVVKMGRDHNEKLRPRAGRPIGIEP